MHAWLAVVSLTALVLMPAPAAADPVEDPCRGDQGELLLEEQQVWIKGPDGAKAGNLSALAVLGLSEFPSWDDEPPTGSLADGSGTAYWTSPAGLYAGIDPWSPSITVTVQGTLEGCLDNVAVTAYFKPTAYAALHRSHFLQVRLLVNDIVLVQPKNLAIATVFQHPHLPMVGGARFALPDLADTLESAGLDPAGPHDITLQWRPGIDEHLGATYLWDAVEVPTGITFNAESLVGYTGVDLTEVELPEADPVVVAQFDTGTNPFHPCFRRDYWDDPEFTSPRDLVPDFPADAETLELTFADSYDESLDASADALDAIEPGTLYAIAGTNQSFYGLGDAKNDLVDYYPHGSQAASQIGCAEFGMAADAQLVILNWYRQPSVRNDLLGWVADQPWIDIVHLNIQDTPIPVSGATDRLIQRIIRSGKLVVIAAGNGVQGAGAAYPMELSRWNGPPGSFIAGANDNGGYTYYSNYNPHAVMDGMGTVAAQPYGFGQTTFSGTSSASPRISGYAARLLGALRAEFGHTGEGLLTIPEDQPRPDEGPLADGVLSVAELHEVIRRTADPNPHDSAYNGSGSPTSPPQPVDTPFAVYPKMGYGQLSEHTMPLAVDVAAGREPPPDRPVEDQLYEASEAFREAYWD